MDFTENTTYRVLYPFYRAEYIEQDTDGPTIVSVWTPGAIWKAYGALTDVYEANGLGSRILTCVRIVSIPSLYHPRVLYAQRWQDPDDRTFGNTRLRMCSLRKFAGFLAGYPYPYTIKDN